MTLQKRICAFTAFFLCVFLLLSTLVLPVTAAPTREEALSTMDNAASVWFSHLESDRLVASKNETVNVGAGSSVKVMAGLLLCESLADDLYDEINVTSEVLSMIAPYSSGRKLGFKSTDVFAVYDLLYIALCGSYNDAFYVLALYSHGTIEAFVSAMNARAAELGMDGTHFEDLTGIVSGSRTTAEDMAKLAVVAYRNNLYMEGCSYKDYVCHTLGSSYSREVKAYNNNALISVRYGENQYEQQYFREECRGMSAGSTDADGNCVVTIAEHGAETYVCVVLGGKEIKNDTKTDKYGYIIINNLLDWVYKTYSYVQVLTPGVALATLPVSLSASTTQVRVCVNESLEKYLPKDAVLGTDITYSFRLFSTELEAPFEENTHVGYVAVIYDGEVIGVANLYTMAEAEQSLLNVVMYGFRHWLTSRGVIAGLLFFLLAMIAWIVTEYVFWYRRHRKWDKYFGDKIKLPDKMLRSRRDPDRLRNNKKQ